ncbi:MAG: hypothetical protein ACRD1S_07775 [Vicinamibacterales bacterium]
MSVTPGRRLRQRRFAPAEGEPRLRVCLGCGKPHRSTGPDDRLHQHCRARIAEIDARVFVLCLPGVRA